ncbi:hypothetical protein [Polaromonas sp. DSR2-3-2]|uniref:hypothetical protein n=1 Tax=Polaromonas sp. DSR2-3-2 TaxID=2804622 RepID=UPI003CF4E62F
MAFMPPHSRHQQPLSTASIEVHVELIDQLFNSIDPSPFHARDMDPGADAYIVDSSKGLAKDVPLALIIHLDQPPTDEAKLGQVARAIQTHFAAQAATTRLQLRELFGRGRISLLIGLSVLSLSIGLGEVSNTWLSGASMAQILHQSVLIGGWVAMWRPMEIFLYDWWPIAARIRLLDRLATMQVHIVARQRALAAAGSSSDFLNSLKP